MGDKPSYLGLLNAVAQGEWRAHQYLNDWIAMTDDPEVQSVLRTVAAREGEHAMSFTKRLDELGFAIKPREPDAFETRSADIARSNRSDLDKLDALGYGTRREPSAPDAFDDFFRDHSIDPTTGALLGRYVCEERDSERRLQALHSSLAARVPPKRAGAKPPAKAKPKAKAKAKAAR